VLVIASKMEYSCEGFEGMIFKQSELFASEFSECTFTDCNFQGTILRECRFVDCSFSASDLSLVEVPGTAFLDVRFEDSKVVGVNWSRANWSLPGIKDRLSFFRTMINHSTFLGLSLPGLKVIDCSAWGADFREADLSDADFNGTDLKDSLFSKTDLTAADFSRARNYLIHPGQNTLTKAKFSMPEALALLFTLDILLVDEG
jgi:uncharacterized protein YjbI with pentapeptide repeats